MRAHTITTQARVGGRGRMKRRIVPGGILALSLAVALLAATASTASARTQLNLWCAPLPTTPITPGEIPNGGCLDWHPGGVGLSFDFGDRQLGTTSPAQGIGLGVWENGDTFNPRISVSGDYAQTNNCPPTLSAGPESWFCLIRVTFAPTSTGPKEGTLSTGPGGPTATLTGNGVTTPTPPVLPLTLDKSADDQKLRRSGVVKVGALTNIGDCLMPSCPDYDTKLVLRGDVKKTTKHLATNTNRETQIKARLKHLKQLREEPTAPKIKIKFTATDEFGQTATEKTKLKLCSRFVPVPNEGRARECVWHPSRK